MIDTGQKLAALLPLLHEAAWVALDTEADSLHSYPEKVCLIQLTLPSGDYLIDPLASVNLEPLFTGLRPHRLILHGADYDLRLLYRGRSFVPERIFDTMLAARLLGEMEFGLVHLAAKFLGVQLQKGSQKANWSQRPLTPRMEEYAINDTRHLQPLAALLEQELRAKGRLEWHEETCARLIRDCTRDQEIDPDSLWRIKGADKLDRRGLAVLRELWLWREAEAQHGNKPPYFITPHEQLIVWSGVIAQDRPFEGLIPPRFSPRRREALLTAVQKANKLPMAEWPKHRRNFGTRLRPEDKHRLDRLIQHRDREAAQLGIDPTLIASKSTLVLLTHNWDANAPHLMNWQRALLKRPE
ncbi:MAG TPA: HRDC domain-containing protein [Verrucomicrobiae bacterium]|nr:HRDC domain-containing protein [Verrucomicrobiae bacterium]